MFQELVPLLTTRALTITISREGASTECIRLNVVPIKYPGKDPELGFSDQDKRRKEEFARAAEGLNTPLTITGTPEEIDRELPTALTNYVAGLEGLRSNLEQVKKELEEAHQAALAPIILDSTSFGSAKCSFLRFGFATATRAERVFPSTSLSSSSEVCPMLKAG